MDPRYSYTRLLVRDFAACFRFYRDVMGLTATFGEENDGYADFDTGATTLALFSRQHMADAVGSGGLPAQPEAQDRVALIFTVDNVDATAAELSSRGARFITEPQDRPDWGGRVAHFRDPDGTLIELFQSISMAPTEGEDHA
ncbi:MAG TPA: VOC family protein [Ktedonobacterales bacterium]|nr:VOC family protein [Ktedonobacterales bacterium]